MLLLVKKIAKKKNDISNMATGNNRLIIVFFIKISYHTLINLENKSRPKRGGTRGYPYIDEIIEYRFVMLCAGQLVDHQFDPLG